MTARDPRTDPRPGDVVRKAGTTDVHVTSDAVNRKVTMTDAEFVGFASWYGDNGDPNWGIVRRDSWKRWCRGAEVVRLADPERAKP